jgi:BirA family biotin operon repressor/biotin-[acetyl-CoA-carboxylase] ligase
MKDYIEQVLISNMDRSYPGEDEQRSRVTRAAVWKHIKKLKDAGCEIESVNNKGYRLLAMPNSINKEFFTAMFGNKVDVHVMQKVDSTNEQAKRLAREGCRDKTLS